MDLSDALEVFVRHACGETIDHDVLTVALETELVFPSGTTKVVGDLTVDDLDQLLNHITGGLIRVERLEDMLVPLSFEDVARAYDAKHGEGAWRDAF